MYRRCPPLDVRLRNLILVLAGVLIVLVVLFLVLSGSGRSGARPLVGEPIADFTVTDSDGNRFHLSEEYAKGPVILVFYRGYWCGICQEQLKDLEAIRPELEALGAQLVAISTDSAEYAKMARENLGLGFRVIPDNKHRLLRLYDHRETYSNSDVFNPAIYIVDQEGIVRWAHFGEHAADRPSSEMVYRALVEVVDRGTGTAALATPSETVVN